MTQLFFIIAFLVIYFLPSLVGYQKKNISGIVALNLLTGWTVVGWIVAFVWAATKD